MKNHLVINNTFRKEDKRKATNLFNSHKKRSYDF